MENEQEKDTQNQEDLELEGEEGAEEQEEEKPIKKEFSDEDKLVRAERMAAKLRKKLGKDTETPKKPEEKAPKSDGLDMGTKAFLVANGVRGKEEVALVEEWIEQTGKEVDDILENKHFKNELNDLREAKATEQAVPKGSKRAGGGAKDDVSVAVAKYKQTGEFPADQEMREKVVDHVLKTDIGNKPFYNSWPIAI